MERLVVAHKDPCQGPGHQLRSQGQHQCKGQQQSQAFFQDVFQLRVVLGAVVEADDGGRADTQANEHGDEDEVDVHDDAVGGDAVLPGVCHELQVIEHTDQAHGEVAHQLRGAVGGGPQQGLAVEGASAQPQKAGVGPGEVNDGDDGTGGLGRGGGHRRADEAPAEYAHEQGVQHNVGAAGDHSHDQRQIGLLGGHAEALEGELQNVGRQHRLDDAAVGDGVLQHLPLAAQELRRRAHEGDGKDGQHDAANDGGIGQQGENFIGLLPVAGSQGHGHQGRAAGAHHEAQGAEDHDVGHDEVDGGEGGLAGEIGDENAVHHAVDAGEDHHGDGGQGKPDQPGIGEMVGQLDGHKLLL